MANKRPTPKPVVLPAEAAGVVDMLNAIVGSYNAAVRKVNTAQARGYKAYASGHPVPVTGAPRDMPFAPVDQPAVPPSLAKKLALQKLNEHSGGGLTGFIHRIEHGATSLPGEVAHGVAVAAPAAAHAAERAGPAVIKAVPKTVTALARAQPKISVDRHGRPHVDLGVIPSAGRHALAGAEGLGAVGQVTGSAALNLYENLVRGAGSWASGIGAHPGGAVQPEQQGITPPAVGKAVENVLAGGAGAVASLRHPKHAITDVAKGGVGALVGIGLAFGAVDAMSDPNTSYAEKKAQVKEPLMSVADALQKAYGSDVSVDDAFKAGMENPFFYGTNAWTLVSGGVSSAAAVRNVLELGQGATIGDMVRAARSIRVPKNPRRLRIRVEGGTPEYVTVPSSRSPLYRTAVSKPYDVTSQLLGSTPGLRRLPWAETPRAVRAKRRQLDRMERRLPAQAQSVFNDVASFVNKHGNRHYSAALAVLLQKPKGFTDQEWMRAAMEDIQTMLDTGRFVGPEEKVTPGVQRLLNRVRSYQAKEEAARSQRLSRASYRVSAHQTNLANALEDITGRRAQLVDERKTVADDPTIPAEEKQTELDQYDAAIRALDSQRKVARQELDDLSVNREPIDHPNRDQFRQTLEQIPYFKENPEAIDDAVAMVDARAHAWSGQTGKPASEYWGTLDTRLAAEGDIPAGALLQARPGSVPGLDEAKLNRAAQGIYGRYAHLSGAMPPSVKGYKGFASKGREIARLARLGERHKDWYTRSGRAIRNAVGDDWDAAKKIAAMVAYLSRADSVLPNTGHALRAYSNYLRDGDVGLAGRYPNVVHDKLNDIMGGKAWGGLKTNSFYRNILEEVDKRRYDKEFGTEEPVTVDRWVVRAFGHTDDLVSAKGRYLSSQEMIQHLADQFGWTPKEVQAAMWVGVKAERMAAKSAKKVAERNAKNKKAYDAKVAKGRAPKEPFKPERPKTVRDVIDQAGYDVATGLAHTTHQMRLNYEAAPGSSFDGFPEFATWPPHVQDEFARAMAPGVTQYMRDLRLPFSHGEEGPGIWEPPGGPIETNLGLAANVAVGSAMRQVTAAKYGVDRVSLEFRAWADGVAAGLGRGLRQNAQGWLRPMVSTEIADSTAMFVPHANLTRDEMLALREARGDSDWQIVLAHGDGGVWVYLVKDAGMDTATFRAKADTMIEQVFGDGTEAIDYAHESGYVENDWRRGDDGYQAQIGNSGRPDEIRGASDALADHYDTTRAEFTADPVGAAKRARQRRQRRERTARDRLENPPDLRNQTRQGDILGASEWLGTPDGKRIIYLTENADASTVVHELVGHATEELRTFYPQEFAKVEEAMGKVYADWAVADHEQFAQWAEQYFRSGLAPTPELAPVMSRMKTWMRSIYEGLSRLLGARMPQEARVLFDSYFGAYDDENVARIALNMGLEETSRETLQIERFGGAKVISQEELRALKRRVETRRYNRSLDGMVNRLDELTKELDDLRKSQATWTPEQEAEYTRLSADVLRQQAEIVVRADKREQSLRRKLSDLEKSLQKGTDSRAFEAALRGMRWLADDRERILQDTFGSDYNAVFSNRRDLLADWLVSRGLLEPDFQAGTAHYFPHTLDSAMIKTGVKGPAYALVSNVVGKTKTDLLKLHKRNQMILWQRGDWNADPAVLFEAHARALSYDWMNQVKQSLYDVGRPLTYQEATNLPHDVYLINLKGTPVSIELRQQLKSAMGTEDVQRVHDGIEGMDNAELEANLKSYWDAFAIDANQLPAGFDPTQIPDLRVVPKSVVHGILRPLSGSEGPFGKAWDVGTTVARAATIYANVPGYMLANAVGNVGFLALQQGLFLPRALKDAHTLYRNPYLYDRIQAETGEVPLQAMIVRGRGFSKHARKAESRLIRFESVVDRIPRALAWMHEARKHGYRTSQQMLELIEGKTAKTAADREIVADAATNHMVDFNRASPHERAAIARILFIWPWVRGATAYPFWYGKNYPVRSGVLANIGLAETQRQQDILGPVPPWYSSLYPISRKGERAQVINTASMSPTGTAADSIRLIEDTIASALGRKPDKQTAALLNNFNPLLKDLISFATHKDAYGQDQSLKDALGGTLVDLVPGWRIVRAMRHEGSTPRAFRKYDRDLQDRVMRTFVRIAPQTVTVPWLNAQAWSPGGKSTSEKIDQAVADEKKAWETIEKGPFPTFLRRAATMKVVYEDRLAVLAKERGGAAAFTPTPTKGGGWNLRYSPTPYEQAKVLYAVVKQYYPAATQSKNGQPPHVPTPESILAAYANDPNVGFAPKPNSAAGKLVMERYRSTVERAFFGPASKATTNAANKLRAGQVQKQKQMPAARRRRAQLAGTK